MNQDPFEGISLDDCPVRHVLSRFADKWSVLVLILLQSKQVIRFKEMQRSIPDISQKMLTSTLRTLEEDGLVNRKAYAEVPPRVEYSLTERAHTLLPHINALIGWAKENMDEIVKDRNYKRP